MRESRDRDLRSKRIGIRDLKKETDKRGLKKRFEKRELKKKYEIKKK